MLVELLCLLVFTIRLVHYARVIPREKFWKDPKNLCIIVIIVVGGASGGVEEAEPTVWNCSFYAVSAGYRAGREAGNGKKPTHFGFVQKAPIHPPTSSLCLIGCFRDSL